MAEQECKELRIKRGNIKRMLTNYEQTLSAINEDTDISSLDPAERLKRLEEAWSEFQLIQTQLEVLSMDDEKELKSCEIERSTFENRYFSLSGNLKRLINKPTPISSREHTPSQSISESLNNEENLITSTIKLPTINLPTFGGSYDTWLGFSDTFTSIVHQNEKIPNVQKLHYLRSCLTGDAAQVIAALETSSANYLIAWNLLEDRFNNRRFIIESHTKAILELPYVSKDFSIRALVDHLQKHTRALRALNQPVDSWDTMLIHIIKGKLNQTIREKWEESTVESALPTMKDMLAFLQRRAQFEETRLTQLPVKVHNKIEFAKTNYNVAKKSIPQHAYISAYKKATCFYCQGDHAIYTCKDFLKLSIQERLDKVRKLQLCSNCLHKDHQVHECRHGSCRKCKKKHNSLLHVEEKESQFASPSTSGQASINMQAHSVSHSLVSTAIVDIRDSQGNFHPCRVLLDNGSQSHYITQTMASLLNLQRHVIDVVVTGLDLSQTTITQSVSTLLKSRFNAYETNLEFFIVPRITSRLPSIPIHRSALKIPQNIKLADPEFHKPAAVDVLIGVQLFYKLLCIGQIKIPGHDALLQKTHLGWIVAGDVFQTSSTAKTTTCHLTMNPICPNNDLTRFWELEEVPNKHFLSKDEQACESHFVENTKRDESGRYIVKLPFNDNKEKLGNSYNIAKKRLFYLENKFKRNPSLKEAYSEFLTEYELLGHMSQIVENDISSKGFFLPHHAVFKEDRLTSKIRVVFDGSATDSHGLSLNNVLMTGPTIQEDLFSIYIRFRSFPYVMTADIEKMYRQVLVAPDDSLYQKILWRKNTNDPIKIFRLNTVTYGTAPAPYLATRVLLQLAIDEGHLFPLAAEVLKRDFYVDDLLTGATTFQDALKLRNDLIQLVQRGGFMLRKWASNDSRLVEDLINKSKDDLMSLSSTEPIKTLGISWLPNKDSIIYTINNLSLSNQITKRSILSDIAKFFDPLGLLSPIIVHAKLIIQFLWKLKVTWDEPLPHEVKMSWLDFKNQLSLLNEIHFDRCTVTPDFREIQLHGFCDASEKAYAACIYLRSTDATGQHHSHLVCSKSRVAPVHPVTLPRLELCAALLLARLYVSTKQALKHLPINKQFFWSDSTITLHWIQTPPHNLKTFVANRVGEIQEVTNPHNWKHVSTKDNPADLPSRGRMPREFLEDHIWQCGPQWLVEDENAWPQLELKACQIPESRKSSDLKTFTTVTTPETEFLMRFSSMRILIRVTAYCRRFIHNLRKTIEDKLTGELSKDEIESAHVRIINLVQSSSFSREISKLSKNENLDNKSKIIALNPFLHKGMLKVGGRLSYSNLSFDQKHPILLPRNHYITSMIIREQHIKLKHAGVQATLYAVRQTYWPLDGRNITRKTIRQCVTCFRAKPRSFDYTMGSLPADRLNCSRPFSIVGIDYCGPFFIKEKRYRNTKKLKSYVAIYVCFVTRAVHLELVGDLTTESFIGSLKRLFARRGKANKIYSDNATNFVGANRQLKELSNLISSIDHKQRVKQFLDTEEIIWNFSPPRSPHFGGLWEAAVKSFKHHFSRTVGDTVLTYEQLQTYVVEIEAILNSRPLTPLSSDPNDLRPLTPGHFLIGSPLTCLPEEDLRDNNPGRMSLWNHAQQLRQHFWCRWHKEYLNELIMRSKWKSGSSEVKIGALVILKEDNLPPMQWSLGRIIALHPGPDGVIRVATVKTQTGVYKRSVKILCPLPVDSTAP